MRTEDSEKKGWKQKVAHEFKEVAVLTVYRAVFFGALTTYSMLLLGKFHFLEQSDSAFPPMCAL